MTTGVGARLSADRLRAALGARPSRPAPTARTRFGAFDALYPGREIENEYGTCFVAEWSYPMDHSHGHRRLSDALTLDDRGATCITQISGHRAPERPVFLDTETTGLSGGTGTYAFLIGLGSVESDRVVVRQYFMRDYDEEPALLEAVSSQLARHDALVTYNGRAFDIPLIETRFIASRRSAAGIPRAHLDLLFPARRLLRGILERCSLSDVERAVLGYHRRHDLPSWMIPSVYFQFLREGDARLLGGVLGHNRDDILSLLALTGWFGTVYRTPLDAGLDPRLHVRAARTYEVVGWRNEAIRALSLAIDLMADGDGRAEAALDLARLQRSTGAGADAERMWCLAAEHPDLGIDALIAWAKYLEHERRDFDGARRVVEQALVRVELRAPTAAHGGAGSLRQALEHRLARIARKGQRDVVS